MADPNISNAELLTDLRCGIVLRAQEDTCDIVAGGDHRTVRYARAFPSPRIERVSPGNLVALAVRNGVEAVVWRWYDAVVLERQDEGVVRMWEPAHGEVLAQQRSDRVAYRPGTRAYLSAGLPGAEWWVAGQAVGTAQDASVELDEVEALYTAHGLWDG